MAEGGGEKERGKVGAGEIEECFKAGESEKLWETRGEKNGGSPERGRNCRRLEGG